MKKTMSLRMKKEHTIGFYYRDKIIYEDPIKSKSFGGEDILISIVNKFKQYMLYL